MRIPTLAKIAAASAVILLAACSGNGSSSISQLPGSSGAQHSLAGRSTSVLPPMIQRIPRVQTSNPRESFNSCPSSGELVYAADFALSVVNIYSFSNNTLSMCGQLAGLTNPQGMTVHSGDLLVANTDAGNVLRYHRGASTPFKTYTDPTGTFPTGVTVLKDRTVVVSNIFGSASNGSLSTFHPNGTYVGTFFAPNNSTDFFVTSLDGTSGTTIFTDGFDTNGFSAFWTGTCPAGACSGLTEVGEAMAFPGGVADTKSGDVLASDQTSNTADTFEMPSLTPVTFSWNSGGDTDGIDNDVVVGSSTSHVFGADALNNEVNCFNYKQSGNSTGTCGTGAGNSGGQLVGVAVDPGS